MTEPRIDLGDRSDPAPRGNGSKSRAAVLLMLVWVFLGAYKIDLVEAIHDGLKQHASEAAGLWGIAQLGSVILFVALTWALKRRIEHSDGEGPQFRRWWWAGAAVVVSVHLCFILLQRNGTDLPLWADVLGALVIFVGMLLILLSGLNADPATLVSSTRRSQRPRDWARACSAFPIAAGTLVLFIAEALWFPFDVHDGVVKDDFFHEILTFIPLLLIALGIELNFFRRREAANRSDGDGNAPDPVLRAAPIVTGILLVVAILLAASTLTYDHSAAMAAWHVYFAFAVSVQASTTGLASVLGLVFATSLE